MVVDEDLIGAPNWHLAQVAASKDRSIVTIRLSRPTDIPELMPSRALVGSQLLLSHHTINFYAVSAGCAGAGRRMVFDH